MEHTSLLYSLTPHKIPEDCTILFYHASQQFTQLSAEVNLVPHPSYRAQKVFLPFNFYIIWNCVITKHK